MGQLSPVLRSLAGEKVAFMCPACNRAHAVYIGARIDNRATWTFDGNVDLPSFHPSVDAKSIRTDLTEAEEDEYDRALDKLINEFGRDVAYKKIMEDTRFAYRCHSWVKAGTIAFVGDSTHSLAGKTVPLAHWSTSHEEQKQQAALA